MRHTYTRHIHCICVWVHIYMYTHSLSAWVRHNYTQHLLSLYKYVAYFIHAPHTCTESFFFLHTLIHTTRSHPTHLYSERVQRVYLCVSKTSATHLYTPHSLTHTLNHALVTHTLIHAACIKAYGVATSSRLLKIMSLFCKRAL